jgi:Tfp pilus assembly protein PilV
MNFNRFDGRADQAAAAQFQQDDAICKGEVAKAQAMAAPIYMGRSLADAMEAGMLEGQRNSTLRQIMVGCMAQRGYSVTMVTVPN